MAFTNPFNIGDLSALAPRPGSTGQAGVGLAGVQADPNITKPYQFPLVNPQGISFNYPAFGVDANGNPIVPPTTTGAASTSPATTAAPATTAPAAANTDTGAGSGATGGGGSEAGGSEGGGGSAGGTGQTGGATLGGGLRTVGPTTTTGFGTGTGTGAGAGGGGGGTATRTPGATLGTPAGTALGGTFGATATGTTTGGIGPVGVVTSNPGSQIGGAIGGLAGLSGIPGLGFVGSQLGQLIGGDITGAQTTRNSTDVKNDPQLNAELQAMGDVGNLGGGGTAGGTGQTGGATAGGAATSGGAAGAATSGGVAGVGTGAADTGPGTAGAGLAGGGAGTGTGAGTGGGIAGVGTAAPDTGPGVAGTGLGTGSTMSDTELFGSGDPTNPSEGGRSGDKGATIDVEKGASNPGEFGVNHGNPPDPGPSIDTNPAAEQATASAAEPDPNEGPTAEQAAEMAGGTPGGGPDPNEGPTAEQAAEMAGAGGGAAADAAEAAAGASSDPSQGSSGVDNAGGVGGGVDSSGNEAGGGGGDSGEGGGGESGGGGGGGEAGGGNESGGGGGNSWRGGPITSSKFTPLSRVSSSGPPAYQAGGPVAALTGPNPPSPDDGFASLQRGEYVVRQPEAERYAGTLRQINAGTYDPGRTPGYADGGPVDGIETRAGGGRNVSRERAAEILSYGRGQGRDVDLNLTPPPQLGARPGPLLTDDDPSYIPQPMGPGTWHSEPDRHPQRLWHGGAVAGFGAPPNGGETNAMDILNPPMLGGGNGMGTTSPGQDQGPPDDPTDPDNDYDDDTQTESPLMGPDNAGGITAAAAMQNLAQMPTAQRQALAAVASDPSVAGALLDVLGPSFMPVLQAMTANGIPAGLPGPGQPGAPMPGGPPPGMGAPPGPPMGGSPMPPAGPMPPSAPPGAAAPPGVPPPMPPPRRPLAAVRA